MGIKLGKEHLHGEMAMETENDFGNGAQMGFVDRQNCAVREAVLEFLNGTPPVRRFCDGVAGCEIFRTPDRSDSGWCVLEMADSEVQRALDKLNQDDPPGKHQCWSYLLSQPSWENGQWRHAFKLMQRASMCLRTSKVPARDGWKPSDSGLSVLLHEVCMGDDICARVPRPGLLLGLARHLVGKAVQQVNAPLNDDAIATVQCSPNGTLYCVYTVCELGPTHIFSEDER